MNAQTPIPTSPVDGRKLQIRGPLSLALDLIATQGQTYRDAARRAGLHETSISRALAKPHVQAELERRKTEAAQNVEALKGLAKIAAYRVGMDLMHNSPDHKVRAKMVELFAGEAKGPAVVVQMNQGAGAGYHYPRRDMQSGAGGGQVIDGQAEPVKPE